MSQLLIATNNPNKMAEYTAIFANIPIQLLTLGDVGLDFEVNEIGQTYADNAALKACAYADASDLPTLADDNGLEVIALNGKPGLFSHRWAGPTDNDRITALLQQMTHLEDDQRRARFVCHTMLRLPDGQQFGAEGIMHGTILHEPRGTHGIGYDSIFLVNGTDRTFAELSHPERVAVSHRGNAAQQLLPTIQNFIVTHAK